MVRFVAGRLAFSLAAIAVITLAVTLFTDLMPGDPATIIAGENATPAVIERVREETGVDRPVLERYGDFWSHVVDGDLGHSVGVRTGAPVTTLLGEAIPVTLALTAAAILVSILLGIPLGYAAALRPGAAVDRIATGGAALVMAFPSYVIALLLITVFAVGRSSFLPPGGYVPPTEDIGEWLRHLVLPALALGAAEAGQTARHARAGFVDVLERDHMRAADAKGLGRLRTHGRHLLRNAAAPITTIVGLNLVRLLGGSVIVEAIFVLPGAGSLAYDAVNRRDIPLLQGIVFVSAVGVLLVNLAVDLVIAAVDPRVRARR